MMKLMNFLMLSCKKSSELIDKSQRIELSMRERFLLRMHTSMCDGCKAYQKQSKLLDKILGHFAHQHNEDNIPVVHNEELQTRIKSQL